MVKVRRNFELVDDADNQDYGKTILLNFFLVDLTLLILNSTQIFLTLFKILYSSNNLNIVLTLFSL
jgi:hypothetical protein